jgi:hypothetical protein
MKRITLLASFAAAVTLAACGGAKEEAPAADTATAAPAAEAAPAPAPAPAPMDSMTDTTKKDTTATQH